MKIVIATAVYYPQINGVAVFSHNLAMGLAARGHEVVVICPSQTGRSYVRTENGVKVYRLRSVDAKVYPDQIHPVPKRKKILGVRWPRLFYRHGLRVSVFPQREVARILGDFEPDVVHVQVSDPIGLSVVSYARRHGIPVVTTEHNQPEVLTDSLKMPRVLKKGANVVLASYFRNRQGKSDFVTMPTEKAIRGLLTGARRDLGVPVAAVSNGVNLSCFKPGRQADAPTVVYVGRLDPEKKVGIVVEAFAQVLKMVPEAKFLIAGDGVDKPRLEKLVADLGIQANVEFLGKVLPPELYKVYQKGWVFATASEIETQGIVLIEAAASGLPLIAVDKGAVSEVCRNGENGFLCKVDARGKRAGLQGRGSEIAEISDALAKILTDEKLRRGFAARSLEIAHEHDLEKTLDKFENIYKKVTSLPKI